MTDLQQETAPRATTIDAALAGAIECISHKKFGLAVVGMLLLTQAQAPAWMIFGMGAVAIGAELVLDLGRHIFPGRSGPVASDERPVTGDGHDQ